MVKDKENYSIVCSGLHLKVANDTDITRFNQNIQIDTCQEIGLALGGGIQ